MSIYNTDRTPLTRHATPKRLTDRHKPADHRTTNLNKQHGAGGSEKGGRDSKRAAPVIKGDVKRTAGGFNGLPATREIYHSVNTPHENGLWFDARRKPPECDTHILIRGVQLSFLPPFSAHVRGSIKGINCIHSGDSDNGVSMKRETRMRQITKQLSTVAITGRGVFQSDARSEVWRRVQRAASRE
ncbi:hypothetical protein BaRGS_00015434 [Batillaria attramentaria]|uniref:Uncharacterized protein n=1 Tax=Batillaria attramentaria TaxID=370345 RepID=A0ABD0L267_9CAEN